MKKVMGQVGWFSKFLFLFSLTICLFSVTNGFAEGLNYSITVKGEIGIRSVLHWEKGTATNTKIGDWELISTDNRRLVKTRQEYSTTTTTSRLKEVKASIEGKGGFVTGTVSAGHTLSGEEKIKITYEIITEEIVIYDLYKRYKYYYKEAILVNEHGYIYDRDPYAYFIKKEFYSSKEDKTGSEY